MSERTYNRLANALLMVGIASAIVCDSGWLPRVLRVLAGIVGIASGVAAAVLYFWNQLRSVFRARREDQQAKTRQD